MVVDKALAIVRSSPWLALARGVKISVETEQDAELPSWKYGVITVELTGDSERLTKSVKQKLEHDMIEAVYSQLSPEEAIKILLIFHYVQPG